MNKDKRDEAKEAAWLRWCDDGNDTLLMELQPKKMWFAGFDAGAASVDRRAIVKEAFENLLDRFIGRDFYGYDDIADVMNEALAEMEANNENSKM